MMRTASLFALLGLAASGALAQMRLPDTLKTKQIDEIVITATRNERQLTAVPMPVTVLGQAQLRNMGSLRLNEALAEMTGLVVVPQVNGMGNGIQVQGFNPDYTLILVDGEPLVGRSAGVLELTRIAVGNIKQIEIVKGPSSSLYGSEALAGVINIITQNPEGFRAMLQTRYGANRTLDLTGELTHKKDKLGLYFFANHYATGGYDLTPNSYGQTVEPFQNQTLNGKITYQLGPATRLSVAGRWFAEGQDQRFDVGTTGQPQPVGGRGRAGDWNLNPVLTHRFGQRLKLTGRLYATRYFNEARLTYQADGALYDATFFKQGFTRPEVVGEWYLNERHVLTLGAGHITETVEATRYENKNYFRTNYGFFQYEWQPRRSLSVIAGGRYDAHSEYQGQFSPKLSAQWDLAKWLAVRGSVGVGFKAPDFRQLYLNFNNAVAGYTVLGAREAQAGLARLQQEGQILQTLMDPSRFGTLRAESSLAYNLGLRATPTEALRLNLNFFHNEVQDLIEFQPVALKTNGQSVFTYFNVNRVFTQGLELEGNWQLAPHWQLAGGYQLLVAKDRAALERIAEGGVFARDPVTLATRRVTQADYGGLFNRSRYSANLKLFYEHPGRGLSGSVRAVYRSRFGFADLNGNQLLDDRREYAEGFVTLHLSVAKTFARRWRGQLGADNLLGYTNPLYLPNLPGRLWWASLSYRLGGNP
ncbi:MAG: TonB-dependent receptor [Bernardetiaceae bacterium]|nr:TonB-dependent receptor [Bernardetiaceae bacterium]